MYRRLNLASVPAARAEAVAVMLFDKTPKLPGGYRNWDNRSDGAISGALKRAELSMARGAVTALYPPRGPQRVYVLGLGDRDKPPADSVRAAAAALVKAAHAARVRRLRIEVAALMEDASDADAQAAIGRALGDGLAIGNFGFTTFKGSIGAAEAKKESRLDLSFEVDAALREPVRRSLRLGESVSIARTLAATPPNVANPDYIAGYCRKMARQVGLRCSIIDAKQAQKLKMGGLLAVGAGGSTAPALIVLEHRPRKGAMPWTNQASRLKARAPILLVGKAITFDTGGYSIKPAADMDKMKYDKCGGMAVIGALHAAAVLNIPQHVVGLIPCAENMIGQRAYRPGDILTFTNGVTCEVTNTDAEGRLVLADALAYGCRTYKPRAVIDLATLTGGVVVALGSFCAGCFCGDTGLRQHLFDAADFTGERLWHLPLWQEHRDQIKGTHGDIVNAGPREAHPIQGAAFLSYFVPPDMPWAHLDIAGVADVKTDGVLFPKGPTGYGVRLLVRALETWR